MLVNRHTEEAQSEFHGLSLDFDAELPDESW